MFFGSQGSKINLRSSMESFSPAATALPLKAVVKLTAVPARRTKAAPRLSLVVMVVWPRIDVSPLSLWFWFKGLMLSGGALNSSIAHVKNPRKALDDFRIVAGDEDG